MPAPGIARAINDIDHEVRVIRALYPEQCLGQCVQSLSPALIASPQTSPRIYHNTGVQVPPPPNGNIFKLSHGRDPSEFDCMRNIGAAATGRFSDDPRSNPYELIYGAAYPAPSTVQGRSYVAKAFQTANFDSASLALVKAKVKASVMASRYRSAAIQAGYKVCAESKDEMIVHSEQFSTSVQLDAQGNLLKGTVERLYLPNICGTSLRSLSSTPQETTAVLERQAPDSDKGHSQIALTGEAPCPSLPQMSISITKDVETGPPARTRAFASSSVEHPSGLTSNFYGACSNLGSCVSENIVYVAGASPPETTRTAAMRSVSYPRKIELSEKHHSDIVSQKSKISSAVTPKGFLIPAAHSSKLQTQSAGQLTYSRPSVADQDRALPVRQPNSTVNVKPNMACSADRFGLFSNTVQHINARFFCEYVPRGNVVQTQKITETT